MFKKSIASQVLKKNASPLRASAITTNGGEISARDKNETKEGESIRVYLRMRPINDKEKNDEPQNGGLKWLVDRESI